MLAPAGAQSTPRCTGGESEPPTVAGGLVHGTVKAGNVPLPGVSVVATNTLTGQRYATITDINGNYSMTIPANGRYVLKTELAAFAPETKVALSNPRRPPPVNQQADFALTLASRVPPETSAGERCARQIRLQARAQAAHGAAQYRRAEPRIWLCLLARRRRGCRDQQRRHRSSPAFAGQ